MGANEDGVHRQNRAIPERRAALASIRGHAHGRSSWDVAALAPQLNVVRPRQGHALVYRIGAGVVSGLAGGVVFGVIMHMAGALVMVAKLVDGQSVLVGWAVHMAISALVGITFGIVLGSAARGPVMSVLLGISYGWLWWVLGGLTLMPLRLGMGLFVFNADAFKSLFGHLVYGLALGAVFAALTATRSVRSPSGRSSSSEVKWEDRGYG